MKTYVFIIRRITDISGAIQYVYNKTNYLENKGWRVLIFSALHGPLYIDKFQKYKNYIFPQLFLTPHCFREKEVETVINQIVKTIELRQGDKCVVESDALERAVWAELIAQRLKCPHLAYFVREKHIHYDENALRFLRYKYERHELAGIVKESIRLILHDESVQLRDDTQFSAYCNNVIEDRDDKFSSLLNNKADYSLGYLGRLEKPCVPSIIEGMCAFISRYPNKMYNVVMIGGSTKKERVTFIRERFAGFPNVNLVLTGNMYPIPLSFVKKIDVFISTAGSVAATYNVGIPTVRVNPLNGEPVGVAGLDYLPGEKELYDSSPDMTIEDCIEKAITLKAQISFLTNSEVYNKEMFEEFERQLSFVNVNKTNDSFDKAVLLKINTAKKFRRVFWLMGHCLGARGVNSFWRICHAPIDIFDSKPSSNYIYI
jgi:hypothetical protein